MALEIEIRSNSKQAEANLKKILNAIDQLPESAKRADSQLKNAFSNSFSGLEKSVKEQNREISRFSTQIGRDLGTLNASVDKTTKSVDAATKGITNFIKVTSVAFTGLLAAGGITSISSQFTELGNRIALVTGRTSQLSAVQSKLFSVARRSNSTLDSTVNLFSNLALNTNLSNKEAVELTETLLKASKIGGGSVDTINSSIIQLNQGLASGTLRGEELNSVLEGLPRVAKAIADELGVGIGKLRELAAQGRISTSVVQRALVNTKDSIDNEFSLLVVSLKESISNAGREIGIGLNAIGDVLSTGGLSKFVDSFGKKFGDFLKGLAVQLRALQTEFLLFRLNFDNIFSDAGNKALDKFNKLVDGINNTTRKLINSTREVKNWATGFTKVFQDLYIEIVGNSIYPDMVDGVVDETKKLDSALLQVNKFVNSYKKEFKGLGEEVQKESAFSAIFGNLQKTIRTIKVKTKIVLNTISAQIIDNAAILLAGAFLTGFAALVAAGGLSAGLGAKIATGFIGAVGAFFAGFAANFDTDRASSFSGPVEEILRNQTNVLLTIADGISSVVSLVTKIIPSSFATPQIGNIPSISLEKALNFLADNIIALVVTLPILIKTLKTVFAGAGSGSLLNPLGGLTSSLGQLFADINTRRLAQGPILALQSQTQLLEAELGGLKEAIRGQRLRLQSELSSSSGNAVRQRQIQEELIRLDNLESSETKKLITQIRENQKKLAINSQLLEGPVSRLKDAVSRAVIGFGQLVGGIGATVGSFIGAGLGVEVGRELGLSSGETFLAVVLGGQIFSAAFGIAGQVLGQVAAASLQLFLIPALSNVFRIGLLVPLRLLFVAGANIFSTLLLGSISRLFLIIPRVTALASAAMRSAIIAAHAIGAVALRAAIIAGSIASSAIQAGAFFLLANAIPIAIGAAVTALLTYAFSDDSIFAKAGQALGSAIYDGVQWVKQLGTDIGSAIYDGFTWIADVGEQIGEAIGDTISKLNPLNWGWFRSDTSSDTSPVKKASGGSVWGAGTGTSDSIPAMLSNGEFVVKESSAKNNRGLLEHLNNTGQLPGYANGGLVGALKGKASGAKEEAMILASLLKENFEATAALRPSSVLDNFLSFAGPSSLKRAGALLGLTARTGGDKEGLLKALNVKYDENKALAGLGFDISQLALMAQFGKFPRDYYHPIMSNAISNLAVQAGLFGAIGTLLAPFGLAVGPALGAIATVERLTQLSAGDSKVKARLEGTGKNTLSSAFANGDYEYLTKAIGFLGELSAPLVDAVITKPLGNLFLDDIMEKFAKFVGYTGKEQSLALLGSFLNADSSIVGKGYRKINDNSESFLLNNPEMKFVYDFISGYASGGSVFGPGTATSDSIPAMLSNGEFVVKASVANQHRSALEQLNMTGKLPRFSSGGSVGSSSSVGSSVATGLTAIFETLSKTLKELLGEENFEKLTGVLNSFKELISKGLAGFGGSAEPSANANITNIEQFASVIKGLDLGVNLDGEKLLSTLEKDANLTQRLLRLNQSRAKVQKEILAAGDSASLELTNQLAVLNSDIVRELGEIVILTEELIDNGKQQIAAIDELAKNSLQSFKGDVQGGLTGLLKGDIGLEEFGKGILDSFTDNVLGTVAGGITEGIFNTEDGELSGFGATLENLFTDLGLGGFGIGEVVGATLSGGIELGASAANPMFVKIVEAFDSFNPGGDVNEFGIGPGADVGLSDEELDDLGIGNVGEMMGGTPTEEAGEKAAGPFGTIFEKFTGKISGIFDGLTGNLGGIFDGLLGGLSGAFDGLMSLFSGGGGGGGLGGLLSSFAGFFNDGGLVPGGGPKPAIVHGGEMILNSRQQSNLFGQLDKNMQSNSQQQSISINVNGDISRQTKKEIFTMLPQIANGVNQYNVEKNNF